MTSVQHPFLAVIAVVILAIATFSGAAALQFKDDALSKAMPSLLTALIVISAVTERATAVITDIWFGPSRIKAEDDVRLVNRNLSETAARVKGLKTVATAAARAGDLSVFNANAAVISTAPIAAREDEIETSEETLAKVQANVTYTRLSPAVVIALLVSAVGIRTLGQLFEPLTGIQFSVFHAVDALLPAGVLTGGTAVSARSANCSHLR
jgi:hypothetical protein